MAEAETKTGHEPENESGLKSNIGTVASLVCLLLLSLYLMFWPVAIEPVAWTAPADKGRTGAFQVNDKLKGLELLSVGAHDGPEHVCFDSQGRLYVSCHDGTIVRLDAKQQNPEDWAKTGGRPLGMAFDAKGQLIVADAYQGLLSIDPEGVVSVLSKSVGGQPIVYADDVDVAADGLIYLSDATTRFSAKDHGGTLPASLLDVLEHGGTGRVLVYDPKDKSTRVLIDKLNFPNGLAVSEDGASLLIAETWTYSILKHHLKGPKQGQTETLISNLPGFPDNLDRGQGGRYWLGLASPRNAAVDWTADKPFARKVIQRLPQFMRPKPEYYGHVVAIDESGQVLADLQDSSGDYPMTTGVQERADKLYVMSLVAGKLGVLSKSKAGL